MTKVVISQPMYFPWYGHLEQLKHCDIYVFYDDVQFSKGSMFNRVQLKEGEEQCWMTVPLKSGDFGLNINQRYPSPSKPWKDEHLGLFEKLYGEMPFFNDAYRVLKSVLVDHLEGESLAVLAEDSTKKLAHAFGLDHIEYLRSSQLGIGGKSSQRVADICTALSATHYITGHGAKDYIDYSLFDSKNIQVQYISYGLKPYPQKLGSRFIPYVSALDCIANCGAEASQYLGGSLVSWKAFLRDNSK